MKITASGNTAQIIADYRSYESDMVSTHRGEPITGSGAVIATVDLHEPVNPAAGSVNLAGRTTLTQAGSALFIAYGAGEELDPTAGVIDTAGGCSSAVAGGTGAASAAAGSQRQLSGISGTFSGFNKAATDLLKETNDTMNGLTTFMRNGQAFMDEYEAFNARVYPNASAGSAAGLAGSASHGAASNGTAPHGGTPAGGAAAGARPAGASAPNTAGTATSMATGSGASARAAGAGAAVPPATPATGHCSGSTGVVSGSAAWGVKESFQSYITGAIAKGSWTLLDNTSYDNRAFHFAANSGAVDPANSSGRILLSGGVHFTGHQGVLDLKISQLEIEFSGRSGQLIAQVSSSDMSGTRTDFGRVALADLAFDSLTISDNSLNGRAQVLLTAQGSRAFADFYEAGTQLAPLEINAALGGAAQCDAPATAAATGTGAGAAGAQAGTSTGAGTTAAEQSTGYTPGQDRFQIRSTANDGPTDPATYLMAVLASIVVAGGAMGRLAMVNPA